jgi:hypothetical protein
LRQGSCNVQQVCLTEGQSITVYRPSGLWQSEVHCSLVLDV